MFTQVEMIQLNSLAEKKNRINKKEISQILLNNSASKILTWKILKITIILVQEVIVMGQR